jgi:hypothetical protein
MKNCLLALISLLFAACALAQPPDTVWTNAIGAGGNDEADGVCTAANNGFYMVGRTRSFGGQQEVWLVRMDEGGDTLWTRHYGGSVNDVGSAICEVGDGAVIVGSTESYGAGFSDLYVIRVTATGDTMWTRAYGTAQFDFGYGVVTTLDGGFAACGSVGTTGQSLNMYLLKFSADGTLQWSHNYGGSNVDEAFALRQTEDGGYLVAGRSVPVGSSWPDMYVVRTNAAGDTLWTHRYGGTDWEEATGILETADGGCLVTGWQYTQDGAQWNFYVVKATTTGAQEWAHAFGGDGYERAYTAQQATDGGYIVGGVTTSSGSGGHDFYFVKLTTIGDTLWTKVLGGSGNDDLFGICITSDGGYLGVGATSSYGHGAGDAWAVRLAGFAGVGGFVRDVATNQPLPNVWVSAIGQSHHVVSDPQGHYVLTLAPDTTYDIITYGPCSGRDTVESVPIFQDSITAVDLLVGVPHGVVPQSSLNIITHNHVTTVDTLRIYNDGLGVLDVRVTASTVAPESAWLSVQPDTREIAPGDSGWVGVIVSPDTTDDGVFDYVGFLTVHSNSCPDSAIRVDVLATVLEANDHRPALVTTYALAAYPNPFNPTTTLVFTLPHDEQAALTVYDVSGRTVETLTSGFLPAGVHRFTFNAAALPSGIYFVRAHTPSTMLTQKLLLLR